RPLRVEVEHRHLQRRRLLAFQPAQPGTARRALHHEERLCPLWTLQGARLPVVQVPTEHQRYRAGQATGARRVVYQGNVHFGRLVVDRAGERVGGGGQQVGLLVGGRTDPVVGPVGGALVRGEPGVADTGDGQPRHLANRVLQHDRVALLGDRGGGQHGVVVAADVDVRHVER